MKLRNIFTMLAAAFALTFVGCEEPERFLDEVKVSKSYISLPKDGGEVKITVTAQADWQMVALDDKNAPVEMPAWFTVSATSGAKGVTELVFSAEASKESNTQVLNIICDGVCQVLNVVQIAEKQEAELKTCDWINTNGEDGVTYRAKGIVTVVNDTYAKYGGFSINDGTATLIVYGSDGNTAFPDLAVGDEVVVEGPWATKYSNFGNGSIVISRSKSLITVEKVFPVKDLSKDGESFTVTLTSKGDDFAITIGDEPAAEGDESGEEAESWITYSEPTVLGTTYIVEFTAAANTGGTRNTTIKFSTTSGGVTYSATVDVQQLGAIPELPVAEAIKLPKDSWFAVAGTVTGVHKKGYVVTDAAGDAIYAYVNKTEEELGVALGDQVVVTGKIGDYANFYQIVDPSVKVVSSGSKPTYPTPVSLETAASFETYKEGKFSSIYVEATGVTTGQYGDIKIGEWTVSPYQTSSTINIADFKDKEVVVKGYILQYKADNILRVMLTSVKEANAQLPTISQVLAATVGDEVETVGTVMATHQKGYIISDATGSIYVYTNAVPTVKIGNKVTLSGTFDNYFGTLQIKNATVSANDNGTTVTYPTPVDLTDQATYDAYATYSKENPTDFSYVKIKAVLSGGRYLTIGESTKQSQLDWSSGDYSALNDKTVIVTAYMKGFHSGGYYQLMETSVVEAE